MSQLFIVPLTLAEANAFVLAHHRHHKPVPGAKFCVGVARVLNPEETTLNPGDDDTVICGVAIVGRPVARMTDDGWTLEVCRTCTDGTPNANSMLYGACRRAVFALGYRKIVTYTLPEESGISLRAAGWKCMGEAGGGKWSRAKRPRVDTHPLQTKFRWEVTTGEVNAGQSTI